MMQGPIGTWSSFACAYKCDHIPYVVHTLRQDWRPRRAVRYLAVMGALAVFCVSSLAQGFLLFIFLFVISPEGATIDAFRQDPERQRQCPSSAVCYPVH